MRSYIFNFLFLHHIIYNFLYYNKIISRKTVSIFTYRNLWTFAWDFLYFGKFVENVLAGWFVMLYIISFIYLILLDKDYNYN